MSKKILAIVLALIIVAFSFASCKKDVEEPYYVNEEGQTQKAEKDSDGKYFVTDDEGNKTYIDEESIVNKDEEKIDSDLQEFVENAEKTLGFKLTERVVGGKSGGGSHLTPEGKEWITKYERYCEACKIANAKLYLEFFSEQW